MDENKEAFEQDLEQPLEKNTNQQSEQDLKKISEQDLEQQLAMLLEADEREREDADREARRKLSPRYEIRVRAELDPIVEETRMYREMAEEIDGRYDKYDKREE